MHPEIVTRVPVKWFSDEGFVVQYAVIESVLQNLPHGLIGQAGANPARRIVESTIEALIERGYCATQTMPNEP